MSRCMGWSPSSRSSSVDLTTPQNTTVTIRNSWVWSRVPSGLPHAGQKLARSSRPLPQFGHVAMPGVYGRSGRRNRPVGDSSSKRLDRQEFGYSKRRQVATLRPGGNQSEEWSGGAGAQAECAGLRAGPTAPGAGRRPAAGPGAKGGGGRRGGGAAGGGGGATRAARGRARPPPAAPAAEPGRARRAGPARRAAAGKGGGAARRGAGARGGGAGPGRAGTPSNGGAASRAGRGTAGRSADGGALLPLGQHDLDPARHVVHQVEQQGQEHGEDAPHDHAEQPDEGVPAEHRPGGEGHLEVEVAGEVGQRREHAHVDQQKQDNRETQRVSTQ